jgi:hypothetical protein
MKEKGHEMEEKMKPIESEHLNTNKKLTWEAPKLYSLDKGKTEGGYYDRGEEDGFYFFS